MLPDTLQFSQMITFFLSLFDYPASSTYFIVVMYLMLFKHNHKLCLCILVVFIVNHFSPIKLNNVVCLASFLEITLAL